MHAPRSPLPWPAGALFALALVTPRPVAAQSEYWTSLGAVDVGFLDRIHAAPALNTSGVGVVGLGAAVAEEAAPVVVQAGSFYTPAVLHVRLVGARTTARAARAIWRRQLDGAAAVCAAHVRAVGSRDCMVIASVPWSGAAAEPTAEQQDIARFIVDHGADVVLGHGASGVQRVERLSSRRGEALVAYGLGTGVGGDSVYLTFAIGFVPGGSGHRVRVSTIRAAALSVDGPRLARLAELSDASVRGARLESLRARLGPALEAVE